MFPHSITNQSLATGNEFRTCRFQIDENRSGRICVPASGDVRDQYRFGLSDSVVTQGTRGKIVRTRCIRGSGLSSGSSSFKSLVEQSGCSMASL